MPDQDEIKRKAENAREEMKHAAEDGEKKAESFGERAKNAIREKIEKLKGEKGNSDKHEG